MGSMPPGEGVFVGYRWFDAHHLAPAYPFGFGLSYTTFKLSHLRLRGQTVSLTVRNTGKRTGHAVPEIYLGLPRPQPSPNLPSSSPASTRSCSRPVARTRSRSR
jgi:beta-glucosidase